MTDVSDIDGAQPKALYALKSRRKTEQSYSPSKVAEALLQSGISKHKIRLIIRQTSYYC